MTGKGKWYLVMGGLQQFTFLSVCMYARIDGRAIDYTCTFYKCVCVCVCGTVQLRGKLTDSRE